MLHLHLVNINGALIWWRDAIRWTGMEMGDVENNNNNNNTMRYIEYAADAKKKDANEIKRKMKDRRMNGSGNNSQHRWQWW